jgi:hypothetical protein
VSTKGLDGALAPLEALQPLALAQAAGHLLTEGFQAGPQCLLVARLAQIGLYLGHFGAHGGQLRLDGRAALGKLRRRGFAGLAHRVHAGPLPLQALLLRAQGCQVGFPLPTRLSGLAPPLLEGRAHLGAVLHRTGTAAN